MLDILRANKNSVLTWIILVAIAVVFAVSFGPGTRGFTDSAVRAAGYAARVNGQAIPAAEFERRYTQLYRIYQQRAGQAFTRELADQLGLRSMAMNGVVERELVLEEAQRHGLHVSDAELSGFVNEMPEFQRPQGGFDETLYKRSTSASYGSPAKFEQRLREDLLYQRMLALLRDMAWVSEDEVYRAWLAEADRADAVVVRFPFAAARADVKVSGAEVQAFLAANGARIEQVYKEDTARYHKPKRVRARHVLVKVAESAPAAEQEAARKKIEAIAERARRGEDFGKLAAETSDEPGAKERGGDLGFFGPGTMARPLEEAAFALQAGQISAPVRSRFGWHVMKVEEVQPAQDEPLEKVRSEIARDLVERDAARRLAIRRAEAALAAARAGKSLGELFPPAPSKEQKSGREPVKLGGQVIAAEETGSFNPGGDYVPRAGAVPGLAADAARAERGQLLPKVYTSEDAAVVGQVKERTRPDPARFPQAREEIALRLRDRRQAQVLTAWMKQLRDRAKIEVNEAFLRGEVAAPPVDLE